MYSTSCFIPTTELSFLIRLYYSVLHTAETCLYLHEILGGLLVALATTVARIGEGVQTHFGKVTCRIVCCPIC